MRSPRPGMFATLGEALAWAATVGAVLIVTLTALAAVTVLIAWAVMQ